MKKMTIVRVSRHTPGCGYVVPDVYHDATMRFESDGKLSVRDDRDSSTLAVYNVGAWDVAAYVAEPEEGPAEGETAATVV
jgi:hypothetical protein